MNKLKFLTLLNPKNFTISLLIGTCVYSSAPDDKGFSYFKDLQNRVLIDGKLNFDALGQYDSFFINLQESNIENRYVIIKLYEDGLRRSLLTEKIDKISMGELMEWKNKIRSKSLINLVKRIVYLESNFNANYAAKDVNNFIMKLDGLSAYFLNDSHTNDQVQNLNELIDSNRFFLQQFIDNIPEDFYNWPLSMRMEIRNILRKYGYAISLVKQD
jgi:hypothetical protein